MLRSGHDTRPIQTTSGSGLAPRRSSLSSRGDFLLSYQREGGGYIRCEVDVLDADGFDPGTPFLNYEGKRRNVEGRRGTYACNFAYDLCNLGPNGFMIRNHGVDFTCTNDLPDGCPGTFN